MPFTHRALTVCIRSWLVMSEVCGCWATARLAIASQANISFLSIDLFLQFGILDAPLRRSGTLASFPSNNLHGLFPAVRDRADGKTRSALAERPAARQHHAQGNVFAGSHGEFSESR